MKKYFRKQTGLSLVEVLLALIIVGVILALTIRQYQIYRFDANVEQVKANVNNLFLTAANYYFANCGFRVTSSGAVVYGVLHPDSKAVSGNIARFSGTLAKGAKIPKNTIVKDYYTQFIRHDTDRTIETNHGPKKVGTIVNWMIQIILILNDPRQARDYYLALNGTCLANTATPDELCAASSTTTGNYIVFENTPASVLSQFSKAYWPSLPIMKQFKQMYTTYPYQYLLNTGGETPDGPQYFVCGG